MQKYPQVRSFMQEVKAKQEEKLIAKEKNRLANAKSKDAMLAIKA